MKIQWPAPPQKTSQQLHSESADAGLPTVGNKQAVGFSSIQAPGQPLVYRWRFSDDSEATTDSDGNPAEWPE